MRDVGQRVPHVVSLVQASSLDVAQCQRWLGAVRRLMFRKFVSSSSPSKGESHCQGPARTTRVPLSKTGSPSSAWRTGQGSPGFVPDRHLRRESSTVLRSPPCRSGQIRSSLRRTHMLRMLRAQGLAGASIKLGRDYALCTACTQSRGRRRTHPRPFVAQQAHAANRDT
jgi:hypothetical protein